jgi:predicted RNA binding protein YcfA (HicA-like mRNA interferase family)
MAQGRGDGVLPTANGGQRLYCPGTTFGTIRPSRRNVFMPAKIRAIIDLLQRDGWQLVRQRGSHRQFRHPRKPGCVTVAGKLGEVMAIGTYSSILKQAGLGT